MCSLQTWNQENLFAIKQRNRQFDWWSLCFSFLEEPYRLFIVFEYFFVTWKFILSCLSNNNLVGENTLIFSLDFWQKIFIIIWKNDILPLHVIWDSFQYKHKFTHPQKLKKNNKFLKTREVRNFMRMVNRKNGSEVEYLITNNLVIGLILVCWFSKIIYKIFFEYYYFWWSENLSKFFKFTYFENK